MLSFTIQLGLHSSLSHSGGTMDFSTLAYSSFSQSQDYLVALKKAEFCKYGELTYLRSFLGEERLKYS